ncbi:uncharacterized protein LODBEIA_P49490 [Lodderomyces beijingensis]|uniref:F-box domain-containing protein n=1 Tax=Lodderomyces beijingensis TaxID=1775926 RepID=A0ABP0ZVZ5_9ASCO
MRNYQLIGRKGRPAGRRKTVEYPNAHLHSLPTEILTRIVEIVADDTRNLLALALTCHRFHGIICKNFLYNSAEFKSPSGFFRFTGQHLSHDTSNKINYLQTVRFVNPQVPDSSKYKTKIAGSYAVESNTRLTDSLSYSEFIKSLGTLFAHSYGLQCLEFTEIAPEFAFPGELKARHASIFKKKITKTKRRLNKLVLKSQTGWSIPLRDVHLSLVCKYFDVINELVLVNFIITNPINLDIAINKVTFDSCSYSSTSSRPSSSAFKDVAALELLRMPSSKELSLIDLVKLDAQKLNTLTIDLSSSMFYTGKEFNFTRYNPFFRLLCSREGGYARLSTLVLTDFGLFTYLQHEDVHSQNRDSWIEPPTNNFETFIKYVSNMANLVIVLKRTPVKIQTCKNCGFKEQSRDKAIETLTSQEWEHFLSPLEFHNNSLRIESYKGIPLYTVSKHN